MKKKAIVLMLLVLFVTGIMAVPVTPTYADSGNVNTASSTTPAQQQSQNGYMFIPNTEIKNFLAEYCNSGIINELSIDKTTGNIVLLHNNAAYLMKKYGVSSKFLAILNQSISKLNENKFGKTIPNGKISKPITPDVYVRNWIIYFTYDDVNAFLFAAASAGPVALALELEAIATMLGGAVGTIIGGILTAIGGFGLGALCYKITQAEFNHQGIYIGIKWNHGFPNIVFDYWEGY